VKGMTTELPIPRATDEDVIEVLRAPGARLVGDTRFFWRTVTPLYARYGSAAVDAALRQIHADIRRRAASEIRDLRERRPPQARDRAAMTMTAASIRKLCLGPGYNHPEIMGSAQGLDITL
jgi:hypothetical protein